MKDRLRVSQREEPLLLIASSLLMIAGFFLFRSTVALPPEIRIGVGFFLFLVLPGLFFMLAFFPHRRFLLAERYPIAIALSLGVFAFPGLIAFSREWSLHTVTLIELGTMAALFGLAWVRSLFFPIFHDHDPTGLSSPWNNAAITVLALALAAFAAWTGALRGPGLDWDHFNYISAVEKLLAWDRASIALFAYRDAPPDPIHSYNLLALQWAIIGKLFRLTPIELYTRSAFLTVPAAALAFYALGRRLFSANLARTAFFLFVCYHAIYGGLVILGMSTFYPDDSQWLIAFPAVLTLFLMTMTEKDRGCSSRLGLLLGLALAALGMAIVHVLWGLAFYLTLASYAVLLWLYRQGATRAILGAFRTGRAAFLVPLLAWICLPVIMAIVDVFVMMARGTENGRAPLLADWANLSPWLYAGVFIVAPALVLAWLVYPFRPRQVRPETAHPLAPVIIMAVCLVVAIPYCVLRYQAIQVTNWGQFGVNPYRAFLSFTWFFLNPLQRSLNDPTMTFYPLYLAGYLCLPALWSRARQQDPPRLALAALIVAPLICFHPAAATLFAKFFTLGYLRRIEKLAAVFALFPLALVIHGGLNLLFPEDSRPLRHLLASFTLAALISLACIPFPAQPPYFNHMLAKTVATAKTCPLDSLCYDDAPFQALARGNWFHRDDVIFSDLWTSFRLTAYLPQFVAVQHKPGTGVADQTDRRLLELEFFDSRTPRERMREILDRFHASGVIVNRSPNYLIYGLPCGHPETIALLKTDPSHFQLLYDQGDWTIFKYLP